MNCKRGTDAVEYCVIAGGIALVIVAAVAAIGVSLTAVYTSVANGFN